jgi:mRNA interferase RelE/StbE
LSLFRVEILPDAEKTLGNLDALVAERVLGRLRWLGANVDVVRPNPLHGSLDGFFKLRVGDVRVVYSLDRNARLIQVHLIGNRDEIYKRRG